MAFEIIRNDITKVEADAIVNTANPMPVFAAGTDAAIYMAAGQEQLLKERQKIGEIRIGEAAVTPAFNLPARYIIHTVGPSWEGGDHGEREAVRSCYENSLKLALEYGCESIAFPLIATGTYGFPKDEALQIAISVFSEFLSHEDMHITLVVFDESSFVLSGRIFAGVDSFIDENYVNDRLDEEYHCISVGRSRDHKNRFGKTAKAENRPFRPLLSGFQGKNARSDEGFDVDDAPAFAAAEMECPAPLLAGSMAASQSLEYAVSHISETFQQSLFRLIDEKGFTDPEVYKKANIDRKLFSKIRSNPDYQPKKITAVALALALELNLDETKDLLARAGYALSPSSVFDLIIRYFIDEKVYDIFMINEALFAHDQPILGG